MAKYSRAPGATSQIFQIFIPDTRSAVGGGLTGLTNATSNLVAYYHRDTDTTATAISLVTMTVGTFTSSGFKEIDATNMDGWYQFCPPNAAFAAGAKSVAIHLKGATNMATLPLEIDLDAQVDVAMWNGTAVSSPATAGIPDVNVKNINNVATTSVTTISANVGTTQPQNFTGTGASALVKSDMVDIAGAAVSTSTAQIGVNAVDIGGTTQTGRDIGASVLLSSGSGTGQVLLTSGKISEVVLTDTVTTYTGNTPQTGDSFARIGVAGVGLTNLGDTRIANLDAAVSTRMATYTQPSGFLAATFPSGTIANTTNITAGTITTAANVTNVSAGGITAGSFAAWTEGYTTKGTGSSYTLPNLMWDLHQRLYSFVTLGTAINIKAIDNTTTEHVLTTDDATNPTLSSWTS